MKFRLNLSQSTSPLSMWNLSYLLISIVLLSVCVLGYQAQWKNVPRQWHVFESKGHQAKIEVLVDAQHVLYMGENRQIVPLDGVLAAIQARLKQNKKEPVLVRIAPGVDSTLVVPLIAQLEGFSVYIDLWEDNEVY